jgi:hypothetical protein
MVAPSGPEEAGSTVLVLYLDPGFLAYLAD